MLCHLVDPSVDYIFLFHQSISVSPNLKGVTLNMESEQSKYIKLQTEDVLDTSHISGC